MNASVVVLAWNEWAATEACLDSLRPTLRDGDEVIVVDNGSTDGTAAGLAARPWVRTVTNAENRGFAGGCNDGAAVATGEVLVFLNNDTLVPAGWLDRLLAPFADPVVVATGPRSNNVSGPQQAPGTTLAGAERWAADHAGQTTEVPRLVGFCLAVRRADFERAGRFDEAFGIGGYEDDDLCVRLRAGGRRLVIAHDAWVHHDGHRTFDANGLDWASIQAANERRFTAKHGVDRARPLLSACLIVKDEAELLPDCLASLDGLVDEVVVLDTGSTDGTVAIASAAGAIVLEGAWYDDFARARNEALDACTGTWILHVDADERMVGDPAKARGLLARPGLPDGFLLLIDNDTGTGDDMRFRAVRLFRRDRARWEGRIHEQVVARDGQPPLELANLDGLSIAHLGYHPDLMAARGKAARNARLALAAAGDAASPAELVTAARALAGAGRSAEALARCEAARLLPADGARVALLQLGAELLLQAGRLDEADEWARELAATPRGEALGAFLVGTVDLARGGPGAALLELAAVDDIVSDVAAGVGRARLGRHVGLALLHAGRHRDAARRLAAALADHDDPALWPHLARACVLAADDAATAAALQVCEASGTEPALLAAAEVATVAGVETALAWSQRLRAAGRADRCPLRAIAGDPHRPTLERLEAAAAARAAFGERDWPQTAVGTLAGELSPADVAAALVVVDELAPGLLGPLLIACAKAGGATAAAAEQALAAAGLPDQAAALREVATANFSP